MIQVYLDNIIVLIKVVTGMKRIHLKIILINDVGLRNAGTNFRQIEENHTTENIIYNELIAITDRTK